MPLAEIAGELDESSFHGENKTVPRIRKGAARLFARRLQDTTLFHSVAR